MAARKPKQTEPSFTPRLVGGTRSRNAKARNGKGSLRKRIAEARASASVAPAMPLKAEGKAARKPSLKKPKKMRRRKSKPSGEITFAKDIVPAEVEWLMPGFIPMGQATFLGGDPDGGKSFASLAIAAIVSTGRPWPIPNGGNGSGGNVLILAAEDDPATTIVPRLKNLGADLGKIGILTPKKHKTLNSTRWLRSRIREVHATFVVIDPVESYVPRGKSVNNDAVMRPALDGLAKLARQENVAILVIRHVIKGKAPKTINKGKGSGSQSAAVRSEIRAGVTACGTRALVHVKCNIAGKAPSLGYEIDAEGNFRWTGVCSVTADDIDNPRKGTDAHVEAFLRSSLPCLQKDLKQRAKKAGIKWGAVERVANDENSGVGKRRLPRTDGKRGPGQSEWYYADSPGASCLK